MVTIYSGFVDPGKIEDFHQNREKFMKQDKVGDDFICAVKDVDEFLKNPKVIKCVINLFRKVFQAQNIKSKN